MFAAMVLKRFPESSTQFKEGPGVPTLTLNGQEANLLLKALKHCLNSCHEGGPNQGCTECAALQHLMAKIQAEAAGP